MATMEAPRVALTEAVAVKAARELKNLAHPLRLRVLEVIGHGAAASPNEAAVVLCEPIGQIGYHVQRLIELGALELESTIRRRGFIEHFYRPTEVGEKLLQVAYEWAGV